MLVIHRGQRVKSGLQGFRAVKMQEEINHQKKYV